MVYRREAPVDDQECREEERRVTAGDISQSLREHTSQSLREHISQSLREHKSQSLREHISHSLREHTSYLCRGISIAREEERRVAAGDEHVSH